MGGSRRAETLRLLWQAQKGRNLLTADCSRDFSVAHGGHNDTKRHCESSGHQRKYSESQSNSTITCFWGESSMYHSSKVISAEVMMAQFIALHNLPFQAADHLSDLVSPMFPDSRIAADFSSKHTKQNLLSVMLTLKSQLLIC